MSEFMNRINSQREALTIINSGLKLDEPLFSLTEKSIIRWSAVNAPYVNDNITEIIKSLSKTLFFLANKSQEQITEDYSVLSKKVSVQLTRLKQEVTMMNLDK